MKYAKRYAATLVGIFASSLALSTVTANAQTAPRHGGTAVIVLGGDPPTLNPATTTGIPDNLIGCMIYQGLVQVSNKSEIQPFLAKSWSISPDGLTYTFDLREGVKWQDGQPFTSDDVKFSLTEVSAKYAPMFAQSGKLIEGIDTPSPTKAVIHLRKPFGPLLLSLSCQQGGAIMPAHVFRGTDVLKNPATTSAPIGTGAFKLAEWKRGDYLRLTRNPDYWENGKPYLDEIVAKIMTDGASRTQALLSGEVDYVLGYYFAVNDNSVVAANAKLKLEDSGFAPDMIQAFFNVGRENLSDKRVRQALMMATDRDYLLRAAWFNTGIIGTMPISQQFTWATNPGVDYRKMYPYDVAKANALLDAAGKKRGADGTRFSINVVYPSDAPDRTQVALALQNMWKQVGVNLVSEGIDRNAQVKRVFQDRDFDVTIQSYSTFGDPALGVARSFISSTIGRPFGNPSGYSNPRVDELFQKGENATDKEERGKYYKELQAILADDLPLLTLREYVITDAAQKTLQGVWGGQGYGRWNNAWIAK